MARSFRYCFGTRASPARQGVVELLEQLDRVELAEAPRPLGEDLLALAGHERAYLHHGGDRLRAAPAAARAIRRGLEISKRQGLGHGALLFRFCLLICTSGGDGCCVGGWVLGELPTYLQTRSAVVREVGGLQDHAALGRIDLQAEDAVAAVVALWVGPHGRVPGPLVNLGWSFGPLGRLIW